MRFFNLARNGSCVAILLALLADTSGAGDDCIRDAVRANLLVAGGEEKPSFTLQNDFFKMSQSEFSGQLLGIEAELEVAAKSLGITPHTYTSTASVDRIKEGMSRYHELSRAGVAARRAEVKSQEFDELFSKLKKLLAVAEVDKRAFQGDQYVMIREIKQPWEHLEPLPSEELKSYKISVKDGKLVDAQGRLLNTVADQIQSRNRPSAIFVMDGEGHVYVKDGAEVGHFHHNYFLNGAPIAAGGEIVVKEGVVVAVADRTGHYLTARGQIRQFLEWFKLRKVDLTHAKIDYHSLRETDFTVEPQAPGTITSKDRAEVEHALLADEDRGISSELNQPWRAPLVTAKNSVSSRWVPSDQPQLSKLIEAASKDLDLEGLGFFNSHWNSKSRLRQSLLAPLVNAQEIRRRQDAIRELLGDEGEILTKLEKKYYKNTLSESRWSRHELAPTLIRLGESQSLLQHFDMIKWSTASFVKNVQELAPLLSDVHSRRLRQLAWVLKSSSDRDHPYRLAADLERLETLDQARPYFKALEALSERKELNLLMGAYAELALYVDIAHSAKKFGRNTFPEILDNGNPVLEIETAHNSRILQNNPESSVPNSIRLGPNEQKHVVITGPNAQGKSTYMRTTAQEIILAQMGSPVHAVSARQTPMTVISYVHPRDDASQGLSLFMAEAKALKEQVYDRVKDNPASIIFMDEIMPGTVPELRESVEKAFLKTLEKTKALSVTATHNWGTAKLGHERPESFKSVHVENYRILPGSFNDMNAMYDGALQALKKVGWPDELINNVRAEFKVEPPNSTSR